MKIKSVLNEILLLIFHNFLLLIYSNRFIKKKIRISSHVIVSPIVVPVRNFVNVKKMFKLGHLISVSYI